MKPSVKWGIIIGFSGFVGSLFMVATYAGIIPYLTLFWIIISILFGGCWITALLVHNKETKDYQFIVDDDHFIIEHYDENGSLIKTELVDNKLILPDDLILPDKENNMQTEWHPQWIINIGHNNDLGLTIDDGCLVVLYPCEAGWKPGTHIPKAAIDKIVELHKSFNLK